MGDPAPVLLVATLPSPSIPPVPIAALMTAFPLQSRVQRHADVSTGAREEMKISVSCSRDWA